ncbi:MAG: alpha/beta fold hydrolase [Vulcanimicrobiota bacterium]
MDVFDRALTLTMDHTDRLQRMSSLFLEGGPSIKVGQSRGEVVYRRYRSSLTRYTPSGEKKFETPLLLVYAMVNKPYILDLLPGRSVIESLTNQGLEVYLLDWGKPVRSDADRGMEFHLREVLNDAVEAVSAHAGVERISLMGYCMGGTLSLIYASLYPEKIKNLITMAAPFDCSGSEGLLLQWCREIPLNEIAETWGNCPGWLLASSFLCIDPLITLEKAESLYRGIRDESFLELFFAMEQWINDTVDVPGRMYTEFMQWCFQQNLLAEKRLTLGGHRVDLSSITVPFLNIIADQDTSVPPASSEPIGSYLGSADQKLMRCTAGHIGLAVSGKAHRTLWPEVGAWIAARSGLQ